MKVLLVTNPATDAAFRIAAESALGHVPIDPEGLQSGLRDSYPRVSVVRGIEDHGAERWYAYREGHWVNQQPAEPAPSLSRPQS